MVVCAKTAPLDSLTQQKLAAPEPAASDAQWLGQGWRLGQAADNRGEVVGRGAQRGPHRREGRQGQGVMGSRIAEGKVRKARLGASPCSLSSGPWDDHQAALSLNFPLGKCKNK